MSLPLVEIKDNDLSKFATGSKNGHPLKNLVMTVIYIGYFNLTNAGTRCP